MKTTALMTICTLAIAVAAYGQNGEDNNKGHDDLSQRPERGARGKRGGDEATQAFRQQQMEARRAHHQQQREDNRAHRESCKDLEPQAACQSIIEYRNAQYAENMTFMDSQHEATIAFVQSHGAEQSIPQEQIDERVAKMTEHYNEMKARMQEGHDKLIAALTELSTKEDLTLDDIKATMKANVPERHQHGRHGKGDGEGGRGRGGKRHHKGSDEGENGSGSVTHGDGTEI